jgi:hypothetical protein
MNVFTTEHPLASVPPSALARRVGKWGCFVTLFLVFDLVLIGPLGALEGCGYLRLPEPVVFAVGAPVRLLVRVPGVREVYWQYLDWWYHDPGEPYSEPYPWDS